MNLVRLNPWREMDTFADSVNKLFNGSFATPSLFNKEAVHGEWKPVVDIYNHEDKIVIKAEIPGVDKNDIHIDVNDGILTLKGERTHETERKGDNYYFKEREFGHFHRAFTLPDGMDPEKIDADYKDGVLKIEIPKPEEKKPRKIDVH